MRNSCFSRRHYRFSNLLQFRWRPLGQGFTKRRRKHGTSSIWIQDSRARARNRSDLCAAKNHESQLRLRIPGCATCSGRLANHFAFGDADKGRWKDLVASSIWPVLQAWAAATAREDKIQRGVGTRPGPGAAASLANQREGAMPWRAGSMMSRTGHMGEDSARAGAGSPPLGNLDRAVSLHDCGGERPGTRARAALQSFGY